MVRAAWVALALVVAVPAAVAQPHALERKRAALKLDAIAPLTVSGRHFGAGESVVVTYLGADDAESTVGVRATRAGAFKARLPVRLGRCDPFTVRAVGARGSRATLQVERRCQNAKGPPKRAPREPKPRDD